MEGNLLLFLVLNENDFKTKYTNLFFSKQQLSPSLFNSVNHLMDFGATRWHIQFYFENIFPFYIVVVNSCGL